MGSLMAEIKRTGKIVLTNDGRLEFYQDGNPDKIGEMVIGIDGLYIDGVEPIFSQRNDPAKLRLASRYDPDLNDGMNGVISYNRLRPDDRMEERLMLQGGPLTDRNTAAIDAGEFRVLVRGLGGTEDWHCAFVATSAYLGRLWTGAANWLGWCWKFANAGDQPPAPGSGGQASADPTAFRSDDMRYRYNVQGDATKEFPHGRIVIYDTHHPNFATAPHLAAVGILRPEPV